VFVQGQAWQFKGWRYDTPAELFGHVRGYYLHYDDQKVPPEIKAWNVRPLAVSRTNLHSGAKAAAMFWAEVDDLLVIKRGK
jgi:parafibromin